MPLPLSATALLAVLATPLLFAAGADARTDGAGCTIRFYSDLADKEPLLLLPRRSAKAAVRGRRPGRRARSTRSTEHWTLPQGDEGTLRLSAGEPLLIACPGKRNNISSLASQPAAATAACAGGANVEVSGKVYALKELSCARHSQGEALKKKPSCGQRNASLYELGFTVREEWHPLIDVCHEQGRSNSLYAQHVLQGEIANRTRKPIPRPSFDVGGDFYPGFSPNGAYRNAETTLRQLLGAGAPIYDSPISKEIHRGHLSPDADFLITPFRLLTYFYINTAPMWGVINAGNWNLMEGAVRKFAKTHTVDLAVATGVYDILKLKDENGRLKEFFMYSTNTRKQLPVPKHVWKVVYDPKSKEGIAFVVLNDPFVERVGPGDKICTDICESAGWTRRADERWSDPSKGYLYCCAVDDLRRTVKYVPKFNVKSVLPGPY